MFDIPISTEMAKHLENYVEEHMLLCQDSLLEELEDQNSDFEPYAPYCGCSTCETRESLMATFEWLRNNNIVDIYVEDTDKNQEKLF